IPGNRVHEAIAIRERQLRLRFSTQLAALAPDWDEHAMHRFAYQVGRKLNHPPPRRAPFDFRSHTTQQEPCPLLAATSGSLSRKYPLRANAVSHTARAALSVPVARRIRKHGNSHARGLWCGWQDAR